jgi:hypothetical protein
LKEEVKIIIRNTMEDQKKRVALDDSKDNFYQSKSSPHERKNFGNERREFKGNYSKSLEDKPLWGRVAPPPNNERSKRIPTQNNYFGKKMPYSRSRKGDREISKSQEISYFCQNLDSPFPLTKENLQIWESSFKMTLTSPNNFRYIRPLLGAYLRFPDQSGYAPNPLLVVEILCLLLSRSADLCDLELTHDVIKDRLTRSSSTGKLTDKVFLVTALNRLQSLVEDTSRRLFQSPGLDFNNLIKISSNLRNHLSNYELIVHSLDGDETKLSVADPILQWSASPTLQWLLNGSLYQASALKPCYSDAEDYVTTIRKVWTMLTFYWGTAAFWPKCTCQSHSKTCGTPILTWINTRGTLFCTKRGHKNQEVCGKPALWRCMRRGHDAICQSCLMIRQKNFMGPSSANSCTDIYDATIFGSHIYGDSLVLDIFDTLSRKPPKEKVNWRTSYRLQPNMLVGVICVPYRNMELNPSMKIHWGEIVLKDSNGFFEEFSRREANKISIRLFSRSDFPEMALIHESFVNNSHLVIIDLRVFVPEVMTVLCTLGQKSFLDGFQKVSFSKYLLNPDCKDESLEIEKTFSSSSSLRAQLEIALDATSIDYLSTISNEDKTKIVEKISRLEMVQTLDQTQRESFIYAIMKPLHCIQGPPGTGKVCIPLPSYFDSLP